MVSNKYRNRVYEGSYEGSMYGVRRRLGDYVGVLRDLGYRDKEIIWGIEYIKGLGIYSLGMGYGYGLRGFVIYPTYEGVSGLRYLSGENRFNYLVDDIRRGVYCLVRGIDGYGLSKKSMRDYMEGKGVLVDDDMGYYGNVYLYGDIKSGIGLIKYNKGLMGMQMHGKVLGKDKLKKIYDYGWNI